MDFLSGAVEFFSSAGLSSIVGMVGAWATKRQEVKLKKLEMDHALKVGELDLQMLQAEQNHELLVADKNMERAEVEGDIRIEEREIGAFESSIKTQSRMKGALRWVRPLITLYLLLASSALTYIVWVAVGGIDSFDSTELNVLLRDIVRASIYLTILSVAWWFGSRGGNLRSSR